LDVGRREARQHGLAVAEGPRVFQVREPRLERVEALTVRLIVALEGLGHVLKRDALGLRGWQGAVVGSAQAFAQNLLGLFVVRRLRGFAACPAVDAIANNPRLTLSDSPCPLRLSPGDPGRGVFHAKGFRGRRHGASLWSGSRDPFTRSALESLSSTA